MENTIRRARTSPTGAAIVERASRLLPESRQSISRIARRSVTPDLLILVLIATILRILAFGNLGIDHFDEGAYAMTADAISRNAWARLASPLQHHLSPLLFPLLSGAAMRLIGRSEFVMFGISIIAGIATVGLVYRVGLRWFGRSAAMTSGIIVCLSDFHILYSRAAMTDALFALLFLFAIACFEKAQNEKGFLWTVAAGITTGLAWNTKHHGWLALVVAGVAGLAHLRTGRTRELLPLVTRIVIAGAIALALYLPWLIYVQRQPGGYLGLMQEHSRYIDRSQVIQNIIAHLRFQLFLEGWATRAVPLAIAGWLISTAPPGRRTVAALFSFLLIAAAVWLGVSVVIAALAFVGVIFLWRERAERSRFMWFPIAFLVVLTIVTPFFRAYSRLLLPWFIAAALLAGLAVARLAAVRWRPSMPLAAAIIASAMMVAVTGLPRLSSPAVPWGARDALRNATNAVVTATNASMPVLVFGEPAVVYYLRQAGREAYNYRAREPNRYIADGRSYY